MFQSRNKDVIVGVCMLCAGLFYLYITTGLPRRGAVDAAFFPYTLAIGMILLAVIHLALSFRPKTPIASIPSDDPVALAAAEAADDDAPAQDGSRPDYRSVIVSLALIAAFTALMRPLGFAIATAFYLFLQFAVLSPANRPTPHLAHAVLAIAASLTIFAVFRYGFGLMLPAGPLLHFIP